MSDADYSIKDGVLVYYSGEGGDIVIPEGVTRISIDAFHIDLLDMYGRQYQTHARMNAEKIQSITLPSSITSIDAYAFYKCIGLQSIIIPDSVTSIGKEAFCHCKGLADKDGFIVINNVLYYYLGYAGSITIPTAVTSIADGAFHFRGTIESVTIPDGVTYIGDSAFASCDNLASINIPDSVTYIGTDAFAWCPKLTIRASADFSKKYASRIKANFELIE